MKDDELANNQQSVINNRMERVERNERMKRVKKRQLERIIRESNNSCNL